jgi:hypothetical protein
MFPMTIASASKIIVSARNAAFTSVQRTGAGGMRSQPALAHFRRPEEEKRMKAIFFHFMPYRDLPDDFDKKYESIWITPPNDELPRPGPGPAPSPSMANSISFGT